MSKFKKKHKKTCNQCGERFLSRYQKTGYCSQGCRHKHIQAKRKAEREAKRIADGSRIGKRQVDPTPDQIEERCKEIRDGWSDKERESRNRRKNPESGAVPMMVFTISYDNTLVIEAKE